MRDERVSFSTFLVETRKVERKIGDRERRQINYLREDLKYWLALNKVPKIGPVTIKRLWEHFGSVKGIWEADEKSLSKIDNLSKPVVKSLIENRSQIDLEEELKAVLKNEVKVLTLEDESYPFMLKNIYDPPPVLYVKGRDLNPNDKPIAIVGTRKASRYGKEVAQKLAGELASFGFTIVSGMALGIDTFAHKGALEAKGKTIAVFGCGIDVIFPPENRSLAEEIKRCGSIVSEFPLGTGGERGNFPRRNRVISGLSLGVIVVEGYFDSGAMITAKYALDQNREVFAVPGNVELDQSKGPHWLIKQGAKLVESVEDVLEELHMVLPKKAENCELKIENRNLENLSSEEQKIVAVLSLEPKHLDVIFIESGLSIPQVSSLLTMLEVKNVVRQLPGKRFILY